MLQSSSGWVAGEHPAAKNKTQSPTNPGDPAQPFSPSAVSLGPSTGNLCNSPQKINLMWRRNPTTNSSVLEQAANTTGIVQSPPSKTRRIVTVSDKGKPGTNYTDQKQHSNSTCNHNQCRTSWPKSLPRLQQHQTIRQAGKNNLRFQRIGAEYAMLTPIKTAAGPFPVWDHNWVGGVT